MDLGSGASGAGGHVNREDRCVGKREALNAAAHHGLVVWRHNVQAVEAAGRHALKHLRRL